MAGIEPEDDRGERPSAPEIADDVDDDERKPLYRDEVAGGEHSPDQQTGPDAPTELSTPTRGGRRPPSDDETQVLPRTQRTAYMGSRSDYDRSDDDLDTLTDEPTGLGRRTRLALLVAAVAGVVVVGLAVGYAVLNIGDRPGTAGGDPTAPGSTRATTASPTPDPAAVITDASMMSAGQAQRVAGGRTWKVALTQRGIDADSPAPACLGPDALTGQPASQQTVLRLLSSSGQLPPGILHEADSYASPEEAARAYALMARALGGCATPGAYLASGRVISGLGDQATGVVVSLSSPGRPEFRSVVLNRTGRVVNVVDVAQPSQPAAIEGVAAALASVTNVQCTTAVGTCAKSSAVKEGPPPLGGDQPGFLATADLPPVGTAGSLWAGTVPAPPDADFTGSGCETTSWAKAPAARRAARTYLLADASPIFGLDEIVLTTADDSAAQDIVARVKSDLDSCATRKLTAAVTAPRPVRGAGTSGAEVTGWTATVTQKTSTGTARFRVGIVSSRSKTVYTFLNPQPGLDLTEAQWDLVTVRAGQRATQVR